MSTIDKFVCFALCIRLMIFASSAASCPLSMFDFSAHAAVNTVSHAINIGETQNKNANADLAMYFILSIHDLIFCRSSKTLNPSIEETGELDRTIKLSNRLPRLETHSRVVLNKIE